MRWPLWRAERPADATPAAARPPMLDPSWTPQKGYAHAQELLAILARHDAEKLRLKG